MHSHHSPISNRQLFLSFCKIGGFTIGGGYAMIPLMEHELVDRLRCISREEFLDLIAIAQSLPGIFAVNMATAVGQQLLGRRGAFIAIVGTICIPITAIVLLAMFFRLFKDNSTVEHIFIGVRPVVVALIAAPVARMARTAHVTWRNVWIPVAAALLIWIVGISPIWVITATLIAGILFWTISRRKEDRA